jgi:hypothetical protein
MENGGTMTLREFLKKPGRAADLARKIGVKPCSMSRYKNGRVPEPRVMEKIIRETGGVVLPNDFFDIQKILRRRRSVA